jgi:hypothetical protein
MVRLPLRWTPAGGPGSLGSFFYPAPLRLSISVIHHVEPENTICTRPGDRFLLEAGRWTGLNAPEPVEIEPGLEIADAGRFQFIRRGHVVRLNIDVSGLLYRDLLSVNARREAWDWGDE